MPCGIHWANYLICCLTLVNLVLPLQNLLFQWYIEVRDANFNMQTLSRDTKDSLNKLDEIFDKKKIEERQELSKLFAKEAFGQLHNWNPTSKEGKVAKAIAHGVVAEVSARMAGNKPGSGFYSGATNESLIGEIQKIAKEKPDVAQSLTALLGAAVMVV